MLIIKYSYGGLGVRASHPNVSYGFRTPGCETGKFAKSLMFDETGNLQHHSNRCTAKGFVSRINDIERASYNGSIEASQASDVGSIPTARSINPEFRPGHNLCRGSGQSGKEENRLASSSARHPQDLIL